MIRALTGEDAEGYAALRKLALSDAPLAFAASADDDFVSSADAVRGYLARAPEAMLFGAFLPDLAGAVGIFRDRHRKAAHKAHIWGMYVLPSRRNSGIGLELMQAAIAHARTLHVDWISLGVSDAAPAARRLYERLGFETWGIEPDALRVDGRSSNEHRMALRL